MDPMGYLQGFSTIPGGCLGFQPSTVLSENDWGVQKSPPKRIVYCFFHETILSFGEPGSHPGYADLRIFRKKGNGMEWDM